MAADWWWGGGDVIHPSGAPGASYCNPFSKGLGWNQNYTKATTFSAGWGAGGYDFSVQTGNQNSSSMNFKFAGRAGQICGRSGPITQNPGVDVAS
jgi:hypothetical protein